MTPSMNSIRPKDNTLRTHRSLNPHPEKITDDLFRRSEFFDPRDLAQVKYEMLRRVTKDGWSVAQAARSFGFSRHGFYRVREAFQQHGMAGLQRERPGPRRAHKFTDAVMGFIEEQLAKDPAPTTERLRQMIEERFEVSVHRRSIERSLARRRKKRRNTAR